jgi:beta-lactamase regulating signal transducer with metallopeptidase domain
MIAEWMLYAALCALGLVAAAAIIERWLLNAGAQVRHVWSAALLLSVAIPVIAYRLAPRGTVIVPASISSPTPSDADVGTAAPHSATRQALEPNPAVIDQSLRKFIPANGFAVKIWIALSAALLGYILLGLVTLARMRRTWRPSDICGVQVLVSEQTGPAVVNIFSPQIVMPEWALAMDRYQLGLMIRHEQEHRRARDPQLLAAAQLALIAMPWNPALWWAVTRLRMAVELDCDARVLRTADPRTYGDLLLEVARPRRHSRLVAVAAFAERAGGLERRIRAIARRRDRVARGARVGAATIGLAVVGIAWVAPHPSVPPRLQFQPARIAAGEGASVQQSSESAKAPALPATRPETLRARPTQTFLGDTIILPTMRARGDDVVVKTPRPAFSQLDSLIYDRLFAGVRLAPDEEIAARLLLGNLAAIQAKQDVSILVTATEGLVARMRLKQERDSTLLSLVSTDAERDLLAPRLAATQVGGGRRGRSGNPPGLSEVPVGQVGGPRSGGGARGRVGGGAEVVPSDGAIEGLIDDVQFRMLFGGITVTPEQEAAAKAALSAYRQKIIATMPAPLPFQLRLQGPSNVVMSPEGRTALLAILSSDADRTVVDSRIVVEVRVINRPAPAPPSR